MIGTIGSGLMMTAKKTADSCQLALKEETGAAPMSKSGQPMVAAFRNALNLVLTWALLLSLSTRVCVRVLAVLLATLYFGIAAQAQTSFTVNSQSTMGTIGTGSGSVDLDGDGVSDGNWTLEIEGLPRVNGSVITFAEAFGGDEFLLTDGDFISGYWDYQSSIGNEYDLSAEFTIQSSSPGVTFQPTLRGSYTFPATDGYGFQNNILDYSIVWSNPAGATGNTPTIIDPRNQLGTITNITNGVNYTQNGFSSPPAFTYNRFTQSSPRSGVTTTTNNVTCNANGFWANGCVAWEIGTPSGYETLTLTGLRSQRREALGFGVISQTDMVVQKDLVAGTPAALSAGQTGSFVIQIENGGNAANGDSAATGLAWRDNLPAGMSLVGADFEIIRNNATFASLSDAALDSVFVVDLANDAVSFDFRNLDASFTNRALQLADVIEVTIEFEIDGSVLGPIENTASVLELTQIDTDPTNDSDSASITAVDPELTSTKTAGTTGALNADGTYTQEFTVTLTNTGDVDITDPTLTDDLETAFGDAFDSSAATDSTGGVTVVPALTFTPATSGDTTTITANSGFDGDTSASLITVPSGATLAPGDALSVTFTVLLDATEMTDASGAPVATANTVTAGGTPPTGTTLTLVGTDEDGGPTTDGTSGADTTPPVDEGAVAVLKAAVLNDDDTSGDVNAGDTITYTYT
ncbi:hypothetical protein, partial [Sagittula sp. SSi028]|uniref:hypothetical protein n=1 Tax=Sagittula sp. SSi028 TaxID=3400636 RepID=UPI003AF9CD97